MGEWMSARVIDTEKRFYQAYRTVSTSTSTQKRA